MVIRTKTLFFNTSEILQISVVKFKTQNTIFQHMKLLQNSSYNSKFKTTDVILMCLEILLHKHKAVVKVSGIAKQTVSRK